MRAVAAVWALALAGCAELGVITDGTSVSYGKPSNGLLIDGIRMPDKGEGFTTREVWRRRGNRYGTDELVEMLTGVSRRLHGRFKDVRLVIADLSDFGGGAAHDYHRSHQSGRDVDLLYFMRDAEGNPFEADIMRVFDRKGKARDKSGISVDVPRMWLLVKELVEAPEAVVQFVFMYEPITQLVLEHAKQIGESEAVIARARRALKQPGDSARHDDHIHVRIYCDFEDREMGCVDIGPLELLAEREAERHKTMHAVASSLPRSEPLTTAEKSAMFNSSAASVWAQQNPVPSAAPNQSTVQAVTFSSLLRARSDRIDLRGWR